jgi:hypothetical protein
MTLHRLTVVAYLAILSGCFNPRPAANLLCGPAGECPSGQTCGLDGRCHAADAVTDAPVDSPPDAPPVACQSDMDCRTPPDTCSTQGTCNLASFTCTFPAVDCSSMTDECNLGVCDVSAGGCMARPRNEGNACGAGTECGPFGACGGFDATCDNSGTQMRACTDHTCSAGTCTATPRNDVASCVRDTTGVTCNSPTRTDCGTCGGFSDVCDNMGTQSCTCNTFTCQNETCTSSSTACSADCTRDTTGITCSPNTVSNCSGCQYPADCANIAPDQSCTCSSFTCQGGGCQQQDMSCAQPCTRNTDGNFCGCRICPNGEAQPRTCTAGLCRNSGVCGEC